MATGGNKKAEEGLLAGLREQISKIAGLATDLSKLRGTKKEKDPSGIDKDMEKDEEKEKNE
jgi:hypothetical protein